MDFTLSPDEEALRDAVREFCGRRYGADALNAEQPADRALWSDLANLGVFALRMPEAEGGAGLGLVEAVLAFEELGRALVPGPLVGSHLAAGLVDGAAEGARLVGWLDATDEPLLLEHADVVEDVLVIDGLELRRVARDQLVGEAVPSPVDPLTPLLG